MDPIDPQTIAGIAINQVSEMEGVRVDPDRKPEAVHWANRGINHLRQTYELDPQFYAQEKAERALIRYVKVQLRGRRQPPADQEFVLLADQWAERAQTTKHEEEHDPEADNGRMDMFGTS